MVQQRTDGRDFTGGGHRRVRHHGARLGLRQEGRRVIGLVQVAEDIVHYLVSLVLVGVAGFVLVKSVFDLFDSHEGAFATQVTGVINSILFVIIVMEILRTVIAHFDDAGLQLKPFLIIGIISAVRHILTVGAQASLGAGEEHSAEDFTHAQVELGVNAAVVIALVLGLVMVWRSEKTGPESAETDTTKGLT